MNKQDELKIGIMA